MCAIVQHFLDSEWTYLQLCVRVYHPSVPSTPLQSHVDCTRAHTTCSSPCYKWSDSFRRADT